MIGNLSEPVAALALPWSSLSPIDSRVCRPDLVLACGRKLLGEYKVLVAYDRSRTHEHLR